MSSKPPPRPRPSESVQHILLITRHDDFCDRFARGLQALDERGVKATAQVAPTASAALHHLASHDASLLVVDCAVGDLSAPTLLTEVHRIHPEMPAVAVVDGLDRMLRGSLLSQGFLNCFALEEALLVDFPRRILNEFLEPSVGASTHDADEVSKTLDALREPAILVDSEGGILHANPAFLADLEADSDEVIHRRLSEFFPELGPRAWRRLEPGAGPLCEMRWPSGNRKTVEVRCLAVGPGRCAPRALLVLG